MKGVGAVPAQESHNSQMARAPRAQIWTRKQ